MNNCAELVLINKKIMVLGGGFRAITLEGEAQQIRARREELYWQKRQLMSEGFNKWQQIQPRKLTLKMEDEAPQIANLSSYFNRIRRLDPPRDRLAFSLFLNVPLRSVQCHSALQDIITCARKIRG